ncbi:hypothetical protein GCM10027436_41390 [Actinophytocola sediminis]
MAGLALVAGVLGVSPAHAGGWAETVLDPPPARIESTVTYTFGFWVLQHGSYPIRHGDLGAVALTAADADGARVTFPATSGATEGHYSAEVVFPHDGVWQLGAAHETLMPDALVAVVTVPGAVAIEPSEVGRRAAHDWGTVRPGFPPTADDAQIAAPQDPPREVAPRSAVTDAARESGVPAEVVVAGGLLVVAVAAGVRRYVRRAR